MASLSYLTMKEIASIDCRFLTDSNEIDIVDQFRPSEEGSIIHLMTLLKYNRNSLTLLKHIFIDCIFDEERNIFLDFYRSK